MRTMRTYWLEILAALGIALGVLAYAVVPVSAFCGSAVIYLNDANGGTGHTSPAIYSNGTCADPSTAKHTLRSVTMPICTGSFGINQGTANDCINSMQWYGSSWGNVYRIDFYKDDDYRGGAIATIWSCEGIGWHNLRAVDVASSFLVTRDTVHRCA